ncbi:MAG: protein kinase [Planctomycetota bacterium]
MSDPAAVHRQACALFDALVERSPDEWEAALERVADSEVAAAARRLLRADRQPQRLGTRVDGALAELAVGGSAEGDPAGVLGIALGPYRVESLIGRGGMGAVYLGRREDPIARVAIKFITIHAPPPEVHARFERETEWLALVDHPGIVRYHSSGADARGRPYLVMDYVDGRPLTAAVPEVATSVSGTVDLVIQVADAVHYLHRRGILHRDLKPANILLKAREDGPVPIVVDLGIARALAASGSDTIAPGPVGTPDYMSPEQRSYPCPPDVRTDVYGVGAVLFALLCGRTVGGTGPLRTQGPASTQVLAPSSAVDPAVFPAADRRSRAIGPDLDAVVRKALAHRVEDRYDSALALAEDLRRWRAGVPVEARRVRPWQRLWKLVRRRRVEASLAAALLLTAIAATALLLRSFSWERRARIRLAAQVRISESAQRFLEREVLLGASTANLGPEAPILELIRSAARALVDQREVLAPEVTLGTCAALITVFCELDHAGEADALAQQLAPVATRVGEWGRERLRFEQKRGLAAVRAGRIDEGRVVFEHLLARLAAWQPVDADGQRTRRQIWSQATFELAAIALKAGDLERTRGLLERGLVHARALEEQGVMQEDGEQSVRLRFLLARVDLREGRLEGARTTYRELRESIVERQGAEGADTVPIDLNLSDIALRLGDVARAVELARRALTVATARGPSWHLSVISAESFLADALTAGQQHREAAEVRVRMIERWFEVETRDPAGVTAADYRALIADLAAIEPTAADLPRTAAALAVLERRLDPVHAFTACARVHHARALRAAGRGDEARAQAELALEVLAADGDHAPTRRLALDLAASQGR